MATIAVIGCGYVGLTTSVCFAHLGHTVVAGDIDVERIERLSRGESPILEAGLDNLLREGLNGGRLTFVVGAAEAVTEAEYVYLCVPTPQGSDGSADLSYIEEAARTIGPHLLAESIVINKSTVPVGSTRVVDRVLGRDDVVVVSNPEFLREGSAVHDFLNPDRIVIGADDQAAAVRVASLYLGIAAPLIVTDPASAELVKYASNAFLATKVSFVNAVAAVCEAVGADMNDVVLGMGYDRRIGHEFLRPGPGFGGSCFVGDETLLVRQGDEIRLLRFDELFGEVERVGASGWQALSWRVGEPTPEFLPVHAFTSRPYTGDVVDIRTKMGRRLTVTADHPVVIGDGIDGDDVRMKLAGELSTADWLPVALGFPMVPEGRGYGRVLDAMEPAGIAPEKVIVRMDSLETTIAEARREQLPPVRRHEMRRTGTLRLSELRQLRVPVFRARLSTVSNGTYTPDLIPFDDAFWRIVGLYLAEGDISRDGQRQRISWSFHHTDEEELVNCVLSYWASLGVKACDYVTPTSHRISVSSRLLAGWFEHVLNVGTNCYNHAIPDQIWSEPPAHKRALLRGLWDGDGSWSYVNGGPSVVLEYGTTSRALADGMVRLLADLGIVARLKVGRTAKSTCDTYWLCISGADQVAAAVWLFPEDERRQILASIAKQAKRIAPTGYRALNKNAAWVRVTSAARRRFDSTVYSLEVPGAHTVVTSFGLVTHQCFPKDTRALVRIAEDGGYDFNLLRGVITVNDEQFERVSSKAVEMVGGSVDGVTVAAWGLTFKARTDDLRESPALSVIERLLAKGAKVKAFDPSIAVPVDERRAALLAGIEITADPYAACDGAEVLLVLTEWEEFKWLDFDKVAEVMGGRRVVDARNLLDREVLRRRGFEFSGIGRV